VEADGRESVCMRKLCIAAVPTLLVVPVIDGRGAIEDATSACTLASDVLAPAVLMNANRTAARTAYNRLAPAGNLGSYLVFRSTARDYTSRAAALEATVDLSKAWTTIVRHNRLLSV
jgi:hypothetical protein